MSYIGKGVEVVTFNTATTLDVAGNITVGGTVDGRDVATDGTKLDTITSGAIADILQDTTPQLGGNLDLNTSNVIGTGNINVTGSITGTSFVSTGDMSFTNNSKAIFGTSPSLEIYHDGSNSILDDVGAGNFKMQLAGADKLEITSTGVDVTGTVTADGLTVDGTTDGSGVTAGLVSGQNVEVGLDRWSGSGSNFHQWQFYTDVADLQIRNVYNNTKGTAFTPRVDFANNGDISFYDDTGTTQGFFWDASTQRLGLGSTNPAQELHIVGKARVQRATNANIEIVADNNTGANPFVVGSNSDTFYVKNQAASGFGTGGDVIRYTEGGSLQLMGVNYIDSNGNVGIGTSSPSDKLSLEVGAANAGLSVYYSGVEVGSFRSDAGNLTINANNASLKFATGGGERMRIDSNGNLLVGTTTAAAPNTQKMAIKYQSTVGTVNSHLALVGDSATNGQGPQILFSESGDGQNYAGGTIGFVRTGSNSIGDLVFGTRGSAGDSTTIATERMRIDSSGNLLVGKTATNYQTVGVEAKGNGSLWATADGNGPLVVTRKTSDGTLADFYKDTTKVGSIESVAGLYTAFKSNGSNLYLGVNNSLDISLDSTRLRPTSDATISLGTGTNRFTDLSLSGGIYLGGTGSANYLDDYEEGTYTATITPSSGSITLTYNQLKYTKIGRLVTVMGLLYVSSVSSPSGYATFNLPFAVSTGDNYSNRSAGAPYGSNWVSLNANDVAIVATESNSIAYFINVAGSAASGSSMANQFQANTEFFVTLTYHTNS